MTDDIRKIIALQGIDNRIRVLEDQEKDSNDELNRKKEEAVQMETVVAQAGLKNREYDKTLHDKKVDLQALKDTLAKYTEQRNFIKKPRELFAIDKEIETTLKNSRLNENETQKIEKELGEFKKSLETEQEKLKIKREEIDLVSLRNTELTAKNAVELEQLRKDRSALEKEIPGDLLNTYRFISKNKNGMALAEVNGDACGGCFISLPPQVINEIRKGEKIIRCTSCARILYLKN